MHRRRQDVIAGLGCLALLTLLGHLSIGGPMLVVHLVVDVVLFAYVAAVLAVSRRERDRERVHHLATAQRPAAAVYATTPTRRSVAR